MRLNMAEARNPVNVAAWPLAAGIAALGRPAGCGAGAVARKPAACQNRSMFRGGAV